MTIRIYKLGSILLLIHWPISIFAQTETFFVREIPPVEMAMNQTKSVPLSPYFMNGREGKIRVELRDIGKNIAAKYDAKENLLVIRPQKDWRGLERLTLKISAEKNTAAELTLLLKVRKKSEALFRYKPESKTDEVYVAGEFNGWNSRTNRLSGPDGDETFSLSLPLAGGRYAYKFVADKRWLPDPMNPDKIPDGFGSHNSVITVSAVDIPRLSGIEKKVSWDKRTGKGRIDASVKFKKSGKKGASIDTDAIAILVNGTALPEKNYRWSPSSEILEFVGEGLAPGPNTVRLLAADKEGNITNEISFRETFGDEGKQFDWRAAVIYSIFTDRFLNGDPKNDNSIRAEGLPYALNYQGGDWEGIIQKIKEGYFNELGVNVLWISPVNDNPNIPYPRRESEKRKGTGYHGYWPISLTETEEHFGTMGKLKELVALAHQKGLKVMLDSVLNHVHEEHPLYKEKPQWFGHLDIRNVQLFDERPLDTWFTEFMPDIGYEKNPDAIQALVDNTLWWIERTGADGLRLDAVKHVPRPFWKSLRRAINEKIELPQKKMFYLLGESISSRDVIMEFVGDDELHGQFDFPLYWAIRNVCGWGSSDFMHLESERNSSERDYAGSLPATILGNHDFPRFISFADGDISPENEGKSKEIGWTNPPEVNHPLSYKKLKLAFTFLLTQPGVPTIYYGDEIGLPGAGDPDNRRKMKFGAELNEDERSVFQFVKKLSSIRSRHPCLREGLHENIVVQKDLYIYRKEFFQDKVVVALNRGRNPETVELSLPGVKRWKNLIDSKTAETDSLGVARFQIDSYESVIAIPD